MSNTVTEATDSINATSIIRHGPFPETDPVFESWDEPVRPAPVPLTKRHVELYVEHVLPGGASCLGRPWHYLRHGSWVRAKWPKSLGDGTATLADLPLDDTVIRRHLTKSIPVAVVWPDLVDCVELDVDAGDDQLEVLHEATWALGRERGVRGLVFQSSTSGGLRYRVPLVGFHLAADLRERTVDALERYGLEVVPGVLEVWPARQPLRLPFGAGSDLWNVSLSKPLTGKLDAARRLHRNPGAGIEEWAHLSVQRRVEVEKVLGPRLVVVSGGGSGSEFPSRACSPLPSLAPPDAPKTHAAKKNPSHWEKVEVVERGARLGRRNSDAGFMVLHWYVVLGLDRGEVRRRYEAWLTTGAHTSRDLTGSGRERVIHRMLGDLDRELDRLDDGVRAGRWVRGLGAAGGSSNLALKFQYDRLRDEHGKAWRAVAVAALTAADRALAADVADPKVRRAVEVTMGMLRLMRPEGGTFDVSLNRRALGGIAGGRMRGGELPYRLLLREMADHGVVSREPILPAVEGDRAAVYSVTLPPAPG